MINNFIQIPTAPKYEMNEHGTVRNIKTQKTIKWSYRGTSRQISLRDEHGKTLCLTYPSLMWLVFGKRMTKTGALPVVAKKGHRQMYFNSCRECALTLAKTMGCASSTVYNNLAMRRQQLRGWTFKFME